MKAGRGLAIGARPDDDAGMPPDRVPNTGAVRVAYALAGARTHAATVAESGLFRIRHPRSPSCEGVIVNIGGGLVAGDSAAVEIDVGTGAAVALTSVAAEKVYRSTGPSVTLDVRLRASSGSRLAWVPQETILFDGARLNRRMTIDTAEDATVIASEIVVFGRLASGETSMSGTLRDSWRLRRAGRLVYAEEAKLEGDIGSLLDRSAIGSGARAAGVLVVARPDVFGADHLVERMRETASAFDGRSVDGVACGVSTRDGIILARSLSQSPKRLRALMAGMLQTLGVALPRIWH